LFPAPESKEKATARKAVAFSNVSRHPLGSGGAPPGGLIAPKQIFVGRPMNVCLAFFVFAGFLSEKRRPLFGNPA
jgi:hypothetical protein